jgi:hypothetical protein
VDLFRKVLDRFGPSDPEGGAPELRLDPAEEVSFRIAAWIRLDPSWQDDLLAEPREEERLRRIDGVLLGVLGSKGWNGSD